MTQLRLFEPKADDGSISVNIPDAENDPDVVRQFSIMLMALQIYHDRSKTRGQAWKKHPPYDSLTHIRDIASRFGHLLDRMMRGEDITQDDWDAAKDWSLDLINYSCFLFRKAEGE